MTDPLDEAALEPMAVANWLCLHGFKYIGNFDRDAAIYARDGGGFYGGKVRCELLVPASTAVPDFIGLMTRLVDGVAQAERLPRAEALGDLLHISRIYRDTRLPRGVDEPG